MAQAPSALLIGATLAATSCASSSEVAALRTEVAALRTEIVSVKERHQGRFQIYLREAVARHTYLVDTTEGRVWQVVEDPQTGHWWWNEMKVVSPPDTSDSGVKLEDLYRAEQPKKEE